MFLFSFIEIHAEACQDRGEVIVLHERLRVELTQAVLSHLRGFGDALPDRGRTGKSARIVELQPAQHLQAVPFGKGAHGDRLRRHRPGPRPFAGVLARAVPARPAPAAPVRPAEPARSGRMIQALKTLGRGGAAPKTETALVEDGWEEF